VILANGTPAAKTMQQSSRRFPSSSSPAVNGRRPSRASGVLAERHGAEF
jgi:hypothetical protein